jgi:predicted dehydrogenase
VRIALVGLGDIGLGAHVPALLRNPAVRVTALVDPDPARREAALRVLPDPGSVRLWSTLEDALDDPGTNAIVLATPPWVTHRLSALALAAGRFVLAEKPVAVSSQELIDTFADVSAAQQARFQAGYTYRHHPAMERLRQWLRDGRLGAPVVVRAHLFDESRDPQDAAHTERVLAALNHGSPLLHDGAHLVDWLAYLLGAPLQDVADAWALRTCDEVPSANLTGARLVYADGTVVLAEVGWWTARLPVSGIEILGDRAHAVLRGKSFELSIDGEDGSETFAEPGGMMHPSFDRQLERFVALVRGEPVEVPGVGHAIACLEAIERIDGAVGKAEVLA